MMHIPTMDDVMERLAPPPPPEPPKQVDVHEAVKQLFQRIPLEQLWAVALDQYSIKQGKRLWGKRAAQRVLQARHKMKKKGRKPYWPKGWVVAPGYNAPAPAGELHDH